MNLTNTTLNKCFKRDKIIIFIFYKIFIVFPLASKRYLKLSIHIASIKEDTLDSVNDRLLVKNEA